MYLTVHADGLQNVIKVKSGMSTASKNPANFFYNQRHLQDWF
jgi:hypothetical protein